MSGASAVAVAATFVWLGAVIAISFLETPLKFRAPGVTLPIGLGIGRLVFRALNALEAVLALVALVSLTVSGRWGAAGIALAVAAGCLAVQVLAVRPRLARRTDRVLTGADGDVTAPRSRGHLAYVGFEGVKVVALVVAGVLLLAG